MTPRELSELMHKYLEATFEQIHKQGGLVVELKGDSILAIWKGVSGDPVFRRKACEGRSGHGRGREAIQSVHRRSNQTPHSDKRSSGPLFLGNIGAGAHYEYGVTGDTVTTASRLDGLNKYLGTNILVSDEVIRDLDNFLAREIGIFLMKGKTQPIVAHELICRPPIVPTGKKKLARFLPKRGRRFAAPQLGRGRRKICAVGPTVQWRRRLAFLP